MFGYTKQPCLLNRAVNLSRHPPFNYLRAVTLWLPRPTSQRITSIARYSFPVYLAYDGRSIGIIMGIAPIEPDETGVISSGNLEVRNQRDKWENPLKLALCYKELMRQGKTKAEIARLKGISRARVTQIVGLLNLYPDIQDYLNNAKYKQDSKLLTERALRNIAVIQNSKEQLAAFRKLIS